MLIVNVQSRLGVVQASEPLQSNDADLFCICICKCVVFVHLLHLYLCCCVLAQVSTGGWASSEQWWGHLFLLGGVSGRTALGTQASSQMASRQVLTSSQVHKYRSTHNRTVEWHLQVPTLCPANSSPAENTAFFFASSKQGVSETIHVNKIYVWVCRSLAKVVGLKKYSPQFLQLSLSRNEGKQTQAPFRWRFWNGLTLCGSRMGAWMNGGMDTSSCWWRLFFQEHRKLDACCPIGNLPLCGACFAG